MAIELLTKAEVAELLKISEDTVEKLMEYLASRKIKVAALRTTSVSMAAVNRQRRARELPCGSVPGMKVVDPNV